MNNNYGQSYQDLPQLVLGFHGCDQAIVDHILMSQTEHLHPSENEYDWLGDGIYFWLNDPQRALEWAEQTKERKKLKDYKPAVIGAIIDLRRCLNLCERESIQLLQFSYGDLARKMRAAGKNVSEQFVNKVPDEGGFRLLRYLDCAVIRNLHVLLEPYHKYDTVYGCFQEGKDAFPGAGIKEKTHIQIAVRNPDCIKGYFLPRLK